MEHRWSQYSIIPLFHYSNRTTLLLNPEALDGRLSTGCERSELSSACLSLSKRPLMGFRDHPVYRFPGRKLFLPGLGVAPDFKSWSRVLTSVNLDLVEGWVEPEPGFVGFRCTQPNLRFAGIIGTCETQQRLILALRT